MEARIVWGILGGLVLGIAFGQVVGSAGIVTAICMAAGALAAGLWHHLETRGRRG